MTNKCIQFGATHLEIKKFNISEFRQKLAKTLIRPYVVDFLKRNDTEFFIYSAGTKVWVEFIIKQIEIITKIKFNRPLFTRDDCLTDFKKCINHIKPKIEKVMKRKYNIELIKYTPIIIYNNNINNIEKFIKNKINFQYYLGCLPILTIPKNIYNYKIVLGGAAHSVIYSKYNRELIKYTPIIIDNNDVYLDNSLLLLCPTYNSHVPENIPAIIDIITYKKYFREINRLLKTYLNII